MTMRMFTLALLATLTVAAQTGADYTGPTPPKADVPYLLHASTLVETDRVEAKQESKKNSTLYWIDGASATARTPLAEPIFIIRTAKMIPDRLELYRFDVKKGRRELELKDRDSRNDSKTLHLNVTKLGKDLYRVEAAEELPNGEYSLSPSGSNTVFAFQVF
jgi:hypothetical protein